MKSYSCTFRSRLLACFISELIWKYGSYRQLVGLLGRVNSPTSRLLPTQENTNIKETRTRLHALSRVRIHDPSVEWGEGSSCHIQRGHCDRQKFSDEVKQYLLVKIPTLLLQKTLSFDEMGSVSKKMFGSCFTGSFRYQVINQRHRPEFDFRS